MSTISPFVFVKSINEKTELPEGTSFDDYNSFIINRALSFHLDSLMYANEMNMISKSYGKMQYDFLYNVLKKKKRFAEWFKHVPNEDLEAVKQYYGYNNRRAMEALLILNHEQLSNIKTIMKKVHNEQRNNKE